MWGAWGIAPVVCSFAVLKGSGSFMQDFTLFAFVLLLFRY